LIFQLACGFVNLDALEEVMTKVELKELVVFAEVFWNDSFDPRAGRPSLSQPYRLVLKYLEETRSVPYLKREFHVSPTSCDSDQAN
jgi:hypothetical protein